MADKGTAINAWWGSGILTPNRPPDGHASAKGGAYYALLNTLSEIVY